MTKLKQCYGLWLPADEVHLTEWLTSRMRSHPQEMVDGKGTYQFHKYTEAMKWVRHPGVAIDVGAHCGLWSMQMVKAFDMVHAIEPVEAHRECFKRNVPGGRYVLHEAAAGDEEGSVTMHTTPGSSGDSWVDQMRGDVPLITIDGLHIDHVDFMKLDTEGFELPALRGARELIERSRPCIIVEQKPGRAQKHGFGERDAVTFLQELGAVVRREMNGDFIMSWDHPAPKVEPKVEPESEQESKEEAEVEGDALVLSPTQRPSRRGTRH